MKNREKNAIFFKNEMSKTDEIVEIDLFSKHYLTETRQVWLWHLHFTTQRQHRQQQNQKQNITLKKESTISITERI